MDIDNDGWVDIFLVNGSRLDETSANATNKLYRNDKNGKFTDISKQAGVDSSGWGNGVCAGDFDNDGLTDLYVTYWGPNRFYRNLGDSRFEEIAKKAGIAGPDKEWSSGCTFLDYDRDGTLDLFVTSYQKFDLATAPSPGKSSTCEWKGMPVFCGPRGLPFGRVSLYRNRGDKTFEDVTESGGVGKATGFYAFTAIAADLNQDGWPDLYVANDSTPSLLFRNEKNGTFREVGTESGVAFNEHGFEQGGMGVAVADFNGDGLLDLMKTNFAGDHPNVYQGTGKGIFDDVVIRAGLGVNPQYAGRGAFEGIPLAEIQMSEMDHDDMSSMMPYLSGTSRRPEAQPVPMTHTKFGEWTLMTMGQGFLTYTMQSTPRGGDKLFGPNWIMPMLSHKLGPGTFTFRSMLSFEPATVTQRRYPLLFQTGETAYGKPLADGQHPHDFFTELAVQYTVPVGERTSLTFYGGPRGEPALGPPAYPHRLSALENPIAVLSHHYQDATHISNNVITAGVTHGRVTFEASGFNGAEPDEKRWGLEKGAIDSWSARMTVLPTSRWAIQASGGMLPHGPRVTVSAQHVRPISAGYIASTLVWGQDRSHGLANSYVGESTWRWKKNWLWGRLERTDRDSTLRGDEEPSRIGQVTALTLGYAHDLPRPAPFLTAALGGQLMVFKPSQSIEPLYGSSTPVGAQFFLRVRFDNTR